VVIVEKLFIVRYLLSRIAALSGFRFAQFVVPFDYAQGKWCLVFPSTTLRASGVWCSLFVVLCLTFDIIVLTFQAAFGVEADDHKEDFFRNIGYMVSRKLSLM
jgi:hypothetical protein